MNEQLRNILKSEAERFISNVIDNGFKNCHFNGETITRKCNKEFGIYLDSEINYVLSENRMIQKLGYVTLEFIINNNNNNELSLCIYPNQKKIVLFYYENENNVTIESSITIYVNAFNLQKWNKLISDYNNMPLAISD